MGLLVNSLSSSYSRPYCFGQKSTSTTTNGLKGGRFKRKEKSSLLKQLLIKANLKRQHKKFFLGRGDDDDDDDDDDHKKKKRKNSPLSAVSPHALDDHEFYVLHNFQFPLQQQHQQPVLQQQQQQQRRLSDAGSNASSSSRSTASSSSRSSSSWPSLGSSIAGIYGSYIGSSPEASSVAQLSPLSSVAQLSPLSSVDSVLQNGSIITHPPSNETISSLGDNEAVDATYSPEGAASSLSSASNVSPRNYNLRPKTPPTPGHLLVAFRASQPSQQSSSSPSGSPQQQQQQQQMGSPVNIPMAVRPIPIQVQRGQFRPSSTAQEIIAAASSGPSGVGGLVLPSMAPPAATGPTAAAGASGVGQQIAISPQLISPIQSISPLPESPQMFQAAPPQGAAQYVPPVVIPVPQQQVQPPRQPPRQRGRQGRVQRVRARPVPGHNFYNSHFIRALPNLTAQKRKQVLQAAIPQRKRILLNYYRDNNLRIPAMMHSPAPGFAPLVPGSPAVTPPAAAAGIPPAMSPDNDFTPPRPPPRQPRLRRQAPPIPFPQIPNIDNMDDDDVDDIDLLFQNRNRAQIRGSLREILDTYCASDKSQADMRIFNRDYLNSVSDICNNNI